MELSTRSLTTVTQRPPTVLRRVRKAYTAHRHRQSQILLGWFDDSPCIERQAKVAIRGRIAESVDLTTRCQGWGEAFSEFWNWLLAWCLLIGLLAFIALCVVLSRSAGPLGYVITILGGGVSLFLAGSLFVALYGYLAFFRSHAWGSFRALMIVFLFVIGADMTMRSGKMMPLPVRAGLVSAMIASAVWTGIYLSIACAVSIIAAVNLQRLRAVFPAEAMIDSLCRATKGAEDWTRARAALSAADTSTSSKEIADHTREAAAARAEVLWQLEMIACGIERHWARMLAQGQDKGTVVWLHDQARRMAAYVRKQKQDILLPCALSAETAANAASLNTALGDMLLHAAWGNWATFQQADVPVIAQPSRLPRILRDAVAIAVPLVILGALIVLPPFARVPDTVKSPILITLASLSAARVVTLVNPQIRDDLATVRDGISILPRGGG